MIELDCSKTIRAEEMFKGYQGREANIEAAAAGLGLERRDWTL